MAIALTNGRVLSGDGFRDDCAVLVEAGRIVDIAGLGDPRLRGARVHDLEGALLLPGFIDVQVNGGGGVLFNEAPTVESLSIISAAHRRFGTTAMLPTVITDDPDVLIRAIEAVREAMAAGVPGIIGIHVEGPNINPARKGTHDASRIRRLDARFMAALGTDFGSRLVTIAPEMTDSGVLRGLVSSGVRISAGHTDATYEQMIQALDDGVTAVTHLFNAMSQLANRAPGVVGAALSDPRCWCGVIVDGRHVHPAVLAVAMRAKPAERFMLVTDAMSSVGTALTEFTLQSKKVLVRDGVCVDEAGVISGSALDMASAVRNTVDLVGLPLATAVRMASLNPARFLGLEGERGRIAAGCRADFVVADERMNVRSVWMDGEPAVA